MNIKNSLTTQMIVHFGKLGLGLLGLVLFFVTAAFADVPGGRPAPHGLVPNPGTQQQELANITFPAPYNTFEFVVTCAACHGGTIDQQAGHFGNWAGTSMASAARDPIFRANQIGVNNLVRSLTGVDGAGNMCFRCHSPNGWYSGRFDPTLAGNAEGRSMMHSIVLSTDDEGIMCEFCHRATGNVTFKRPDLNPLDSVWNMLFGLDDWPHQGVPYLDQAGDPTIADGNPYGDTTLQINDGMTYIGKYSGTVDIHTSDIPLAGTGYTGQTYGIYPPDWPEAGIERSDDNGVTWLTVGQTIADIATYSENTVQPKWTYLYRVYALNADGRFADSNTITVVTPGEIPRAPSNLLARQITGTSISLAWRDRATNETGYRLEWSSDGVNWHVSNLPANTQMYTITGLLRNTTYWMRVLAFNQDGASEYSETITATTKRK